MVRKQNLRGRDWRADGSIIHETALVTTAPIKSLIPICSRLDKLKTMMLFGAKFPNSCWTLKHLRVFLVHKKQRSLCCLRVHTIVTSLNLTIKILHSEASFMKGGFCWNWRGVDRSAWALRNFSFWYGLIGAGLLVILPHHLHCFNKGD